MAWWYPLPPPLRTHTHTDPFPDISYKLLSRSHSSTCLLPRPSHFFHRSINNNKSESTTIARNENDNNKNTGQGNIKKNVRTKNEEKRDASTHAHTHTHTQKKRIWFLEFYGAEMPVMTRKAGLLVGVTVRRFSFIPFFWSFFFALIADSLGSVKKEHGVLIGGDAPNPMTGKTHTQAQYTHTHTHTHRHTQKNIDSCLHRFTAAASQFGWCSGQFRKPNSNWVEISAWCVDRWWGCQRRNMEITDLLNFVCFSCNEDTDR